jgi:hypothetical protein
MSSATWSLLEMSIFFVIALGLGLHQLWSLKKYALKRLEREQARTPDQTAA